MKKLVIIVVLIIITFTGGYIMIFDNDEFTSDEYQKAELNTEKFIRKNYTSIDTIEFKELDRTPMGGILYDGTVNKKHEFSIPLNEDFTVGRYMETSESFPPKKEECKEDPCE